MHSEKTKPQFEWKKFCLLFLAGIINAFGVTLFLAPVNLYDSGISGTSMLLGQLTPDWMSLSLFLLVLNVPCSSTDSNGRAQRLPSTPFLLSQSTPLLHG